MPKEALTPSTFFPYFSLTMILSSKAKSLGRNLKVHFLFKNNTTLYLAFSASHIPITMVEQALEIGFPPEAIKFVVQQNL